MINHKFVSFSAVQIYDISYIHLHLSLYMGILRAHKVTSSQWLDSSVGRALHRYRRGHGFESHSGLNFFQALISQLLKLCVTAMINHKFTVCNVLYTFECVVHLQDQLYRTINYALQYGHPEHSHFSHIIDKSRKFSVYLLYLCRCQMTWP